VVVDSGALVDFVDEPSPVSLPHLLNLPYQWVAMNIWKREKVAAPLPMVHALPKISPRPVLLISGDANELERAMTQKYYSAAKEPKELWEVPDAGHTGAFQAEPEEYERQVVRFFDGALK
jgi:uncharacterized protein